MTSLRGWGRIQHVHYSYPLEQLILPHLQFQNVCTRLKTGRSFGRQCLCQVSHIAVDRILISLGYNDRQDSLISPPGCQHYWFDL